MWPFKKEPDVYIQRPKRRKLDARGKLVFWALVFGAAVVIVYLATSAKGQTPTTHKVPSIEAFEQLRTDNDNKIATAQSTADNAERVAKEALTVITGIDSVLQKLKPTAPDPPYLDVTTDTPLGKHKIGEDISGAMQWALDNLHEHRRPLVLPCGEWRISKTIRTPFRSGLTLLGSGTGRAINDAKPGASRFDGARTLLRWAGEPGGTMFELQGNRCEIGNMVLQGNGSGKAIVIAKPQPTGIATATMLFRPLEIEGFETAVQCGTSQGMGNCDNLRFEWLRIKDCRRGYHGVNSMGMNIHFGQLNVGNVPVGIEMDGGGKLSVGKSVIVGACTLLKVNGGGSVGKNNGYFRLSNTEVDAQAKNGFTLIDCTEPHPIEFYCDGGIQSQMDTYQGTFARLCGGNHLTLTGWDSSFRNIVGKRDEKYGRPSVMIRDSRINGKPEAIWQGEIKARWRDCLSVPWKSDSVWIDGEVAK